MEEGYFALELDQISLGYHKESEKDLRLRVDIEIVNGFDVYRWANKNETKFQTEKFQPLLQHSDGEREVFPYLFGFDGLFLKSTFVDLNNEVMSGLINAYLSVKVVNAASDGAAPAAAAAAPPAKGKGAPAAAATATAPTEEALIDLKIPFATLLKTKGSNLSFAQPISELRAPDVIVKNVNSHIDPNNTVFTFRFFADNNLAEYVLGCRALWWEQASLRNPPHTWALRAADVIDPKAKVPPTAAELRTKYLANIATNVQNQDKIAAFTLTAGGTSTNSSTAPDSDDDAMGTAALVQQLFPSLSFPNGKIHFNQEEGASIPVEEDIRMRGDLWSVEWHQSSYVFLHRSQVRRLTDAIAADPSHAFVPLTMKKVPTPESVAVEGGELFATAIVDISAIGTVPSEVHFVIDVKLQGDMMDQQATACSLSLSCSAPLVEKSPLSTFSPPNSNKDLSYQKQDIAHPTGKAANRDVLQELRDEIASSIERIAQEYVSIYTTAGPTQTTSVASNSFDEMGAPIGNPVVTLEEKKSKFINFLTSNGIFHELQEKLRPKLLLLIKDRYGARGRALGKSELLRNVDTQPSSSQVNIQAVLSELYAMIMKECNLVLNSMFTSTVIQKDIGEIDNPACINDEKETHDQVFQRLLRQANDAEADSRYDLANTNHLDRLQLLDRVSSMGSIVANVHGAYFLYAQFLLRRGANVIYGTVGATDADKEEYDSLLRKAREALVIAYQNNKEDWNTSLLYATVLIECDQQELAEEILHVVLSSQLSGTYELTDFDNEFGGYESDKLCPVHPRCYAVLASLFAMQGRGLQCRKALLLANRSFDEGKFGESASHGKPRRTLVLILSETALFFVKLGQYKVANSCLNLAQECEKSCTEKAQARNKPAITPAHIKFLLKRAQAEVAWGIGSNVSDNEALIFANDAAEVAETPVDKIDGKLSEAKGLARIKTQPDKIIDCYVSAIQEYIQYNESCSINVSGQVDHLIPLGAFVHLGKLLMNANRYSEAVTLMLYGSQCYSSATLCYLLGISYLRMDRWDDAEQALLESNMLDNKFSDCWAYMCIVLIMKGTHRLPEAEQCLFQTLRLGQFDTAVLRELATAFISIDKLQTAEDLIRRAIATETNAANYSDLNGNGGRRNISAYTRKLLADVLAGQNNAAKAIEEYMSILSDESTDAVMKLNVAEKCYPLVQSLGRDEELQSLHNIIANLRNIIAEENAHLNQNCFLSVPQ